MIGILTAAANMPIKKFVTINACILGDQNLKPLIGEVFRDKEQEGGNAKWGKGDTYFDLDGNKDSTEKQALQLLAKRNLLPK